MLFSAPVMVLLVSCAGAASRSEDCFRSNGAEYRGDEQITATGMKCLNWMNTTRDYNTTVLPDSETGVGDHSYCRNPDSSPKPWCYVTGKDDGFQRQDCVIDVCEDRAPVASATEGSLASTSGETQIFEPAEALPAQSESAAVQPVIGISQRVRTRPKLKKDLGTPGYVMAILLMTVIIVLGVGITLGYFYKRGRDLKKQHDQRVYEREMQRITLPLSAFTNPTCEIMDENTIVISTNQTPVEDITEGSDPLMGQAGTPGA